MFGHTVAPVSAPWADSVTPVPPPASAVPHTSNLLYAGVVTGSWSGLLSLAIYGVGRLLGVPFELWSAALFVLLGAAAVRLAQTR